MHRAQNLGFRGDLNVGYIVHRLWGLGFRAYLSVGYIITGYDLGFRGYLSVVQGLPWNSRGLDHQSLGRAAVVSRALRRLSELNIVWKASATYILWI